jgi:hypothetical protein
MIASDRKARETIAISGLNRRRRAAEALPLSGSKVDPNIEKF